MSETQDTALERDALAWMQAHGYVIEKTIGQHDYWGKCWSHTSGMSSITLVFDCGRWGWNAVAWHGHGEYRSGISLGWCWSVSQMVQLHDWFESMDYKHGPFATHTRALVATMLPASEGEP